MKKLIIIFIALLFSVIANADEGKADEGKKEGFLTTKWCAERGYFADCRLESYFCGEG